MAIPMTYLVSTWIFTGVNVSLVTAVPLHARIGLGYVLFLLSLIAIPFIDLMVHSCVLSIHAAYYLTIFSIAVVGVGSGGQYYAAHSFIILIQDPALSSTVQLLRSSWDVASTLPTSSHGWGKCSDFNCFNHESHHQIFHNQRAVWSNCLLCGVRLFHLGVCGLPADHPQQLFCQEPHTAVQAKL